MHEILAVWMTLQGTLKARQSSAPQGAPHDGLLNDPASSMLRAPPALKQGRGSRAGSRLPPAGPPPPPPPHRHPEPGREPGRAAIMLSRLGALLQEAVGAVSPDPGRAGGEGAGRGRVGAGPLGSAPPRAPTLLPGLCLRVVSLVSAVLEHLAPGFSPN